VQAGGVQGVQAHPQRFDLLKIWEKSLKIRPKMASNVCRKTSENHYFGSHTEKRSAKAVADTG